MLFDRLFHRKRTQMRELTTVPYWAATDVGTVRKTNQDNLYLMQNVQSYQKLRQYRVNGRQELPLLFAICDGMGGGEDGEKASELVAQQLAELDVRYLQTLSDEAFERELTEKLQQINNAVFSGLSNCGALVGCTTTILYVDRQRIFFVNIGDSPGFVLSQGRLQAVTQADNRANQMYLMGKITESERWTHKTKNQLTQYLGMDPEELLVSPHFFRMNHPDVTTTYLIGSDGLIDKCDFSNIARLLGQDETHQLAYELVEEAKCAGSRDNVTAIVVRVEGNKNDIG